jgi:transcriptional regulator with XRE-family HTH domain
VIDKSLFAVRLKDERKRLRFSQAAAAEIAGIARETWSRYESGALAPGMEVLAAIAAAGCDVQYILTGIRSGTMTQTQVQYPPTGPPAGHAIAEAATDPMSRQKAAIKAMIDRTDSPAMLRAIQADIETLERMRELGRAEASGKVG